MIYRFGYEPDNIVTARLISENAAVIYREGGMLQDVEILCSDLAEAKEAVERNLVIAKNTKDREFAAYAAALAGCYQDVYGNGGAPESRLYQACEKTLAFQKTLICD